MPTNMPGCLGMSANGQCLGMVRPDGSVNYPNTAALGDTSSSDPSTALLVQFLSQLLSGNGNATQANSLFNNILGQA